MWSDLSLFLFKVKRNRGEWGVSAEIAFIVKKRSATISDELSAGLITSQVHIDKGWWDRESLEHYNIPLRTFGPDLLT